MKSGTGPVASMIERIAVQIRSLQKRSKQSFGLTHSGEVTGTNPVIKRNGFSMLEVMVVAAMAITLMGIAVPILQSVMQNYRVIGDARSIAAQLSLARMRAASEFTQARLNFNTSANTYQLQVWSKSANAFQIEGAVQTLSAGDAFSFGAISAPAGGQTSIAQTQYITFNSRGLSVDSSGNPVGTAAIYIINNQGLCFAITASLAGQPVVYQWTGTAWKGL